MFKTSLSFVIVTALAGCTPSPDFRENAPVRHDRPSSQAERQEQQQEQQQEQRARVRENAEEMESQRAAAQLEQDRQEAQAFEEPTAQDQHNDESDVRITRELRQRVVARDDLSMNAKNCTIIAEDGIVTLRGEVESDRERNIVSTLAQTVVGVHRVDDQLIVDGD